MAQLMKRLPVVAKEYHLFHKRAERVGMVDPAVVQRQVDAQVTRQVQTVKDKMAKELKAKENQLKQQEQRTNAAVQRAQQGQQGNNNSWQGANRGADGRLARGDGSKPKETPASKPGSTPGQSAQGKAPAKPGQTAKPAGKPQGKPADKPKGEALHQVAGGGTSPLLTLTIQVNGIPVKAIVDPGASRTCLSQGVINDVQAKTRVTIGPSEVSLAVPGGANVAAGQEAELDLTLTGLTPYDPALRWACPIIRGTDRKFLLGADVLRHLGLMTSSGINIQMPEPADDGATDGLPDHEVLDDINHVDTADPLRGVSVNPDFPERQALENVIREHADVFGPLDEKGADLPMVTIRLQEGAQDKLPKAKPRPVHPAVLSELHEQFDRLLATGIVRKAHGPVANAVVVVRKKPNADGVREIRPCGDYRELNALTVPDRFPMADMRTFTQDMTSMAWFFIADVVSGFNQQPMHPDHKYLTAVVLPGRFVEYNFAPFGLRNLPSQFQRAVEVAPMTADGTRNYVDDIFGAAMTPRRLVENARRLLARCREKRVKLKGSKCQFGYKRVEVLGYIITPDGRQVLPARVEAIEALPAPRKVPELRSIIGQLGFVAEFIPDVQRVMKPLHELTTHTEWQWSPEHAKAFEDLKDALTCDTVLCHPDMSRPWRLETDASMLGVGGVLWQQMSDDDDWRVITYFSKSFNPTQQRWSTFDQEMFGLVYCLTRADMAPMLKAHDNLTVLTDHRNLVFLSLKAGDTRKHLRWLMLQEYHFNIYHLAGKDNKIADFLSRYAMTPQPSEVLNNVTSDDQLRELQAAAPDEERNSWTGNSFTTADGVVRRDGRRVVPTDAAELKRTILEDAHRYHAGVNETRNNIASLGYTWAGISQDVASHVRDCILCQKTRLANFVAVHMGDTSRSRPFETVAIDTIGPIQPDTAGNRYVYVMIDMFSRYAELVPAPSNNAQAAAHAMWSSVVCRHGVPQELLSDNGTEYINRVVAALTGRLEITHNRTLPYHPASNGMVERLNQEVMRHMRILAAQFDQYANWSTVILPYTQMLINSTRHSTTGFAPMEVLYGSHAMPRRFLLSQADAPNPDDPLTSIGDYVDALTSHLEQVHAEALDSQTSQRSERGVEAPPLEAGDIVLRKNPRRSKLHGHLGPYRVTQVGSNYAIEIAPILGGDPKTVHADQLICVSSTWEPDDLAALQAGDNEEFYVERVVDCDDSGLQLQIKWYGSEVMSWEPLAGVEHTPAVQDFLSTERGRMWRNCH